MVLTDPERLEVWAYMMRRRMCPPLVSKADFRAAVDACDAWAEANATAFNNALPVAYRNNASAPEKSLLLAYICLRRAGILT